MQRRFSHLVIGGAMISYLFTFYVDDDSPECPLHVEAEVARPERVAVVVAERALVRVLALNKIN